MRTYRLGALLLDLEHPERIVADLPYPVATMLSLATSCWTHSTSTSPEFRKAAASR